MSVKLLLMFISAIYAVPLPKTVVQIENFDVFHQQTEQSATELYKNILIKNLIVTSDNLKLFFNMEHSDYIPQTKDNERRFYIPDFDFVDEEDPLLGRQKWATDELINPSSQKMKSKRQIGGLGGAGGDTQMVLGTFQAMMRPMSAPSLGQNSQTQTEEQSAALKIEEDADNSKNEE